VQSVSISSLDKPSEFHRFLNISHCLLYFFSFIRHLFLKGSFLSTFNFIYFPLSVYYIWIIIYFSSLVCFITCVLQLVQLTSICIFILHLLLNNIPFILLSWTLVFLLSCPLYLLVSDSCVSHSENVHITVSPGARGLKSWRKLAYSK
jgi:hypothetical protein